MHVRIIHIRSSSPNR